MRGSAAACGSARMTAATERQGRGGVKMNASKFVVWGLLLAVVSPAGLDAQEPTYPHGTGPTVLIDTSHHNLFSPFMVHAPRLEEEGYRVRELKQPFDREALVDVQITLIKTPLHSRNAIRAYPPTEAELAAAWRRPTPSAFSEEEITILREWVGEGGALLLGFGVSAAARRSIVAHVWIVVRLLAAGSHVAVLGNDIARGNRRMVGGWGPTSRPRTCRDLWRARNFRDGSRVS